MTAGTKMDINKIRIANLKRIIHDEYNDSVHKFANTIGKDSGQFYRLFNGGRSLGQILARKLEILLKIPPYSLDKSSDEETMVDQIMFIPPYYIDASVASDATKLKDNIFVIEKSIIKNSNWQIDKLYGFIANGEAMSPTIRHNGKVIVDCSQTKIVDGNIYALSKNNEIFLRRVFHQIGSQGYEAKADNDKYGKIDFKPGGTVKVLGLVVYLIGQSLVI
jgi:phage repressor protein C with HTH and peptisase S24 domain